MNYIRKILFGIMAAIILMTPCCPGYADEAGQDDTKTLRVGYIDYQGFIVSNGDGTYSGYGVDYLNEISKYTGYKYEYVFGQWSQLLEMLANKEIDLLCNAQSTPEREQEFDYSKYPIVYSQGLLYTSKDKDTLSYGDFQKFDGMEIGILKGNAMASIFDSYAKQNDFSYNIKEYNTDGQLMKALDEGAIDAVCSEHLTNHTGLSLIAKFGADACYIISYKNSPYMDHINFALQEIKMDVDFEAALFHKYYDTSTAASTVQFTAEEKKYIEEADTIVVGLMADRTPLSYKDEEGQAKGMLVELMDLVAAQSGLNFEYQFLGNGQTGYDFLTTSDGDLVAGVAASAFSKPNPMLLQSNTLQEGSVVFVGRNGMNFSTDTPLVVALPAGFINGAEVVSARYPMFDFYYATSNEECLKAIRTGRADVMLQNLYIIRECLQSPLYEELDIFPAFSFEEEEKVVALPENALLMSIVNKSIDVISEEQANDIVVNNTIAKGYHPNTWEILYKYRFVIVSIALLLAAVIVMILSIAIIKQKNYLAMEKVNGKLEITNKQLKEAIIQANRANNAKGQFLSRMSHEIRTPMNAIIGLTNIAKGYEKEPEKIDDCLDKINVSSKVLLNILNDVLDMSAIESNKLKISCEEFSLEDIINNISTIYEPQCSSKGVNFDSKIDVENSQLLGDPLRLSQILLNLVSNAYKFTEPGGEICLSVKETAQKDENIFMRFTVSDTGAGMTEDMKSRLFQPFEQEASDTARKHGGSGLGLSIAKNLVDMMHGAIGVESQQGVGTTFIVDIPFCIARFHEKAFLADDNPKESREYDFTGHRILLAEDQEINAEIAIELLNMVNMEADQAENGRQAVEMFNSSMPGTYDAILMDVQMPELNGYEAAEAIRALEREDAKMIPIFAMTANAFTEDISTALSSGMNGHVSKPIDTEMLYETLYKAIYHTGN